MSQEDKGESEDVLEMETMEWKGEKVSISTLQVHSLTLFHEMFHLVLGTAGTPDHSYNLNSTVRFGTPKAIQNPESYTFYALAYFLGQNTQFTFANSKSANKPPPANPKRSTGDYMSILPRFQMYKQDLQQGVWVAYINNMEDLRNLLLFALGLEHRGLRVASRQTDLGTFLKST
ncbi:hypothetical protein CHU98_g12183 [Xylaria longipes]|nr:hypothetical protein CHU98_g12183 [Xylaria longipes]